MNIQFTKKFKKSYDKLDSNLKDKFKERLDVFMDDKSNPILNDHKLHGRYKDLRSINITGDLRAIYGENKTGQIMIICFVDIGSHSELY